MRAISERPAPIRPDTPSTSPARTAKEMSLTTPRCVRPRTSSAGAPARTQGSRGG